MLSRHAVVLVLKAAALRRVAELMAASTEAMPTLLARPWLSVSPPSASFTSRMR
jgi:hypothetical protein